MTGEQWQQLKVGDRDGLLWILNELGYRSTRNRITLGELSLMSADTIIDCLERMQVSEGPFNPVLSVWIALLKRKLGVRT